MHGPTSNQEKPDLGFGGCSCNWGAHIAGLYQTAAERDDILLGFLHRGDLEGDLQLYCPVERTAEDFRQTYAARYPARKDHLSDTNRFRLYAVRDLYYPEGTFSPWTMETNLTAFFAASQRDGRRNIRAIAEMAWALEAVPGVERLMAYESRLNYFIPGKPWISICMYNVNRFSGATLLNVLRTHPFTISGGVITENPYYEDPDHWLADRAPEFLTRSARADRTPS